MPALPTFVVTDTTKWDRIYAAFGGSPIAYKVWLKQQLLEKVRSHEQEVQFQQQQASVSNLLDGAT